MAEFHKLKKDYALTDGQLRSFIARARSVFGDQSFEALIRAVEQQAKEVGKLRTEAAALKARVAKLETPSVRARAEALIEAVSRAAEAGDLDEAARILAELRPQLRADAVIAASMYAQTLAVSGDVEAARLNYRGASDYYVQASDALPAGDRHGRWGYMLTAGDQLYTRGEIFADMVVLNDAIEFYRVRVEPLAPRDQAPIDWATTQNNLGNVLGVIGARTGGEAGLGALDDAVQAFEAALRVYTEADTPADWAGTQNNLGIVLADIGERIGGEAGPAALNEAIAAYEAALRVYSEKQTPVEWAQVQNNLGAVLTTTGERIGGEAGLVVLNKAVAAYEAALRVRVEAAMPIDWAKTQTNLGNAFAALGERTSGNAGLAALTQSVAAYESALRIFTEADRPVDWAATQNNLGATLSSLGGLTSGEAGLEALNDAIQAFEAALRVRTEAKMTIDWATTQNNLGTTLQRLGARTDGEAGVAWVKKAVVAYEAALRVYTEATMPTDWANTTQNLALAEATLGIFTRDPAPMRTAIDRMAAVIRIFEGIGADHDVDSARRSVDLMRRFLAEMEASP